MKPFRFVATLAVVSLASGFVVKADDSVTPAEVFAEVTKDLAGYRSLATLYQFKDDARPFAVNAWFQGGLIRRVEAKQEGDGGLLTRDFYYDGDSELRFALVRLASPASESKATVSVEERFDFQGGKLAGYIGADKKPVAQKDESFKAMETALVAMSSDLVKHIKTSTAYAGMIAGVNQSDLTKAPAGTVFGGGYSDGVFSGIEEGDYIHMDLRQADGQMVTFLVISKDQSVVSVVTDPGKFQGKKIRVHWVDKVQDAPEARGATRMKVCERLELLD